MQYTRPMIELVYEIRRRASADLKPSIKMANPELLQELVDYYPTSRDTITRTLVKELLCLAGEPWKHSLESGSDAGRQVTKVYRGQTRLEEAPSKAPKEKAHRPVRVYRGQAVAE